MEQEIIDYIKKTRAHGMSDLEIKQNLLNAGWDAGTVEENLSHLKAMENQPLSNKDEDMRQISNASLKPSLAPAHTLSQTNAVQLQESHVEDHASLGTKPIYKKAWVYIVVALLIVLGGGGAYWYYAFGLNSAEKVWQNFSKTFSSKIYKQNFKFSYSDPGALSNKQMESFQLRDLNFAMEGNTYSDLSDIKNPQSKTDVKYTFGSGTTNISTEFKFRLLEKILYLNVGDNPFLNSAITEFTQGKKVDWIKIDLNALEEEANKEASKNDPEFKKTMDEFQGMITEIGKIWEEATFVKVDKTLGREKINNIYTFHFKNSLDKEALKTAFNQSADKLEAKFKEIDKTLDAEDIKEIENVFKIAKLAFSDIIEKLEIKEFETWIGMKDFKLYKMKFVSNAPSIISLVENLVEGSGAVNKSRDAKRLADIRQMASAYELYFNDFYSYPESKDGKPVGISPSYIGLIPEAPSPADGDCTEYFNSYWYEAKNKTVDSAGKNSYNSYEYYFCLGSDVGGYPAGIAKLTPAGIEANITCPGTPEQCGQKTTKPELTSEEKVKEMIQKIKFSAEIKIDKIYSDYNKTEKIEIPENSFDLMDVIKGKVQGLIIQNPEPKLQ